MIEYPKIYGPYKRHVDGPDKNKLIIGEWTLPEFADLQYNIWEWTEKVDGTNIRVHWDGHKTTYGGRTESAQLPAKLVNWLDQNLPEEIFEQAFGETEVTLFGEGYGAGIQKGGVYSPEQKLVLFDVLIGRFWLRRDDLKEVATKLGLDVVPIHNKSCVGDAINAVQTGLYSAWNLQQPAEGLVGRLPSGLLQRTGQPILMKIKRKDFRND